LKGETIFTRSDQSLWRSFATEVLVAVPGRDDIDQLVGTAAAIWDELDVPRTAREVAESLGGEFAAPAEVIRQDVERLLDDLVQRGCIEVAQ
jgi:hypothetical protein